jgi:chromosome segregation ATPase
MVIEEAIESELEEKFEPEALEALKKAAFKIYYLNKYYDVINDKLSDNEARQSELIEQLKLLRLEEEAVMSGAEDEVEENEFQQELMGESQREAMHDSFVESYERRSPKASNLSHTMEYTQERFHALKEVIKDLRHTVQKFQQEKMSISEELDLIQCDRDEAVAASRHVLEGRDSGPNFEATRVPFAQFKEGRKELRLTIQGLEAGKGTINQDVEDERTARKLAEKETAEVKASLVICQRNLKEAHEYFAVLLDTNKQLKADKRRFICELESAEGTGAVRSVPKKENRLDSQDRGLAMEYAALESTSPHVSGNDSGGDLEYPVKLEEETDFKEARQGIRNELDGLRDKIQTLAAEKYQINQERDADNQACQDTKKRVEELEAAIFTFKKNLDEAHSYFQELKKKNSGLRIEIQRVEAEKIELSEETTAAKKRCAEDEARRDQMDESLRDIQRNQEGALHSFGLLRQQNENLEEENDCLVQERDDAKQALEAVDQRTQEMTKALTFYLQNLEEAHSCFESLRGANEELKDERDAASTARDEAETRADLLAQTLSTVRKNLDEAHGAFGDIQHQNEDLRFKIHIFHEERQLIEDAGDGKFPLLQLIATLKEEINSLKTDIAKGELRERELQDAMTSQQTNLEEDRARFGTLRSEIDDLRTKNAALKELDMENLQKEVEELRVQNQECAEAQHELKTKLTSMETTNAWKLHTNEVQLSQKLDTAVREQRLLEERLYKIQVSHEEIQKTASRLETERNAVEKKKNHLQETVGMQGYELLNVRKQLDDIEGIDKFSKDRIEFLKEQLEEVSDRQTRESRGNSTGS